MKKTLLRINNAFILALLLISHFSSFAQLPSAPTLATSNVPEANQYGVLYQLDIPAGANFSSTIPYAINNAGLSGLVYNRVAYFLQLDSKWVWVSMDKFNTTGTYTTNAHLGIPNAPANFFWQKVVTNMNVRSSAGSGVTAATGINGNIEMWPECYGTGLSSGLTSAGVGGNAGTYDFNDTYSGTGIGSCYGSFQIHNYLASQTIFGFNDWNGGGGNLGIGNNPSGHPDWTFTNNISSYTTRKLWILVNTNNFGFNVQPSGVAQNKCISASATTLSVSVASGSLTIANYQWYKNTINSAIGGTLVSTITSSATTSTFTPPTSTAGILYYYCVATTTGGTIITSLPSGAINVIPTTPPVFNILGTTLLCSGSTSTLSIPQTAIGGVITYSAGYVVHTFTAGGSFVPAAAMSAEVLVVGGGGGGGKGRGQLGGAGGGGGGVVYANAYTLTPTSYSITIGNGGTSATAAPQNGGNGGNSIFGTLTANGGGGGGSDYLSPPTYNGQNGGSGGGSVVSSSTVGLTNQTAQVNQTYHYGNNGGLGGGTVYQAGGGGGAGGVGSTVAVGCSSCSGGNGGNGIVAPITIGSGTLSYFGAGGGGSGGAGGGGYTKLGGIGGSAIGGNGDGTNLSIASAGLANTGSGGGGSSGGNSGAGGSGVVIIRYLAPTNTYTWSTGATTSSIVVTPSVNTSYSVTLSNGCATNTSVVTVTVNTTPSITVNSGAICSGTSFTMVPSGASTYTISGGSAIVSPSVTTSYTITGTSALGCAGSNSAVSTVTVSAAPVLNISGNATICAGSSATLNAASSGTALGGVITYSAGYAIHTFTASGTFSVPSTMSVQVLIVAGGGGGGMDMGGGGGGGGVIYNPTLTIPSGSVMNVVVGAGGNGSPAAGTFGQPGGHSYTISALAGGNSSFGGLTAIGGGFGGSSYWGYLPNYGYGGNGGSGGGSSGYKQGVGSPNRAGIGTVGQGNTGGQSAESYYSGGGGGAGGVGISGPSLPHGGPGILYSNMSPFYFGGGGGGGGYSIGGGNGGIGGGGGGAVLVTTGGLGFNNGSPGGGGGTGGNPQTPGGNAGANTGGGGGGGSHYNANNKGGNGGSGIVIIKYLMGGSGSVASTYTWSTGASTSSIVVTPSVTTTYSVAGTSSIGCVGNQSAFTVSVTPIPTVAITSGTICSGNSFTMVPSGATTYTYSSGTAIVSPTVSTNYTVTGSSINGCTDTEISSVTVNPKPTLTVNSGTICSGQSFTMVPSGASTYTYTGGSAIVSPTVTTSYSITGTSAAGCASSNTVISTVNVSPAPALTVSGNATICAGSSATLAASSGSLSSAIGGVITYSAGYVIHTFTSSATFSVQSSLNAEYLVVAGGGGGGGNTGGGGGGGGVRTGTLSLSATNYSITVGNGGSGGIGQGNTGNNSSIASLIVSLGGGYGGSNGGISNGGVGGSGGGSSANSSVAGGAGTAGQGYNGGATGSWSGCYGTGGGGGAGGLGIAGNSSNAGNGGIGITSSISGISSYYGGGGGGGRYMCGSSGLGGLGGGGNAPIGNGVQNTGGGGAGQNDNNGGVPGGNGGSGIVIIRYLSSGSGPSSASSYTWSTGASTSSIVVTPSVTTTYSVAGTSSIGCVGNQSAFTVSVTPIPTVAISSGTICSGNSFTMVPSGATTYTYSSGTAIVSPTVSTNYTVTGSSINGCTDAEISSVTVNPKPTLTVNSGTICSGQSFTMVPSGASTYTYTGGSAIVSPTVTTSYSITGTSAAGCASSNTVISTVNVSPAPALTISGNATICAGSSAALAAAAVTTITPIGGIVTYSAGYAMHTFTNSGVSTWTVPTGISSLSVTVVGGGGGGGGDVGGGGGGGRVINLSSYLVTPGQVLNLNIASQTGYPTGFNWFGQDGGTSTLYGGTGGTVTAIGGNGGRGRSGGGPGSNIGWNGGGGSYNYSAGNIGNGGFAGGNAWPGNSCGGGGGSGGVGQNATSTTPGAGGIGVQSIIDGIFYGGGGGGSNYPGSIVGTGTHGGGNGGTTSSFSNGQDALLNRGSGGGGGPSTGSNPNAGRGSSGVIIIKYLMPIGGSSASTYTWSTGASTSSIIVTPSVTTTYSVAGTSSIGCVGNQTAFTVSVTPIPTVAITSGTICSGNSFTMVPSGATTYTYSSGTAVVSPTVSTNYTVTGSSINGCTDTEISSVTVNPKPTLTVNSGTICSGQSFTMVPSGASTYTYTGGSAIVSPTVTTSYSITGTSAAGCASSNTVISTVNVSPAPALTISGNATICAGSSATLASGTSVSSGPTNAIILDGVDDYGLANVSGTTLSDFTIEAYIKPDAVSQTTKGVLQWANVLGDGNPFVLFQQNATNLNVYVNGGYNLNTTLLLNSWNHVALVYSSSVYKLYLNSVLSYTYSGGLLFQANANKVFLGNGYNGYWKGNMDEVRFWNVARTQPQISSSYSLTIPSSSSGLIAYYQFNELSGTTSADNSMSANTLTLTNGPTWQIPSTAPITTYTSTAASTYTWSTGASTSSIIVTPSVTTTYSVAATSSIGCVGNTTAFTVSVTPIPTVAVSSGTICSGNSFTMIPSGATTYTYSSGSSVVSPTVSTNYTVTGSSINGCTDAEISSVTVNPKPTLTVNSGTICSGQSFTMVPSGASTYTYTGGSAIVSPTVTTSYTITGTSALGCPGSNTVVSMVVVNTTPTITVNSGVICTGKSFTMTPSGATTYTYSSGTNVVSPLVNTSYSVTGTSALGCIGVNTAVSNVTVNTTPTITVNSGVICTGQSFTMTPGGATTYTYSSGTNVVNPLVNTSYSVTGTSVLGCIGANTAVSNVTVNITPTIAVNSGVICTGNSFTMTPSGATTYTYSSGTNVVSPLTNTSYSVTGTSALGCIGVSTAVSNVTVNTTPTITVNSGVICTGQSFTMTPSGATTYTYSSGSNVVNPLTNTTYTVTGTSALGCVASNTVVSSVTVNITPTITVNSGVICTGQSFTMIPSGATTYTYSSGSNVVSPLVNTSYSVTGTSALGCVSAYAMSTITVNVTPTITVSSGAICSGTSYTMIPSGASTYTYSSGTTVVSPLANTSYSVTGTSALGCVGFNTAVSTVTVRALPVLVSVPVINPSNCVVATGSITSVTVTGSPVLTYSWTNGLGATVGTTSNLLSQPAGTYSLVVTDGYGCKNSFGPYVISNLSSPAAPLASASSNTVCTGNAINLFATVAGVGITYTWSGPNSFSSTTQNPVIASSTTLMTGVYNVFASAAGCTGPISSVTITVNTTPTITVNSGVICTGNSFTMSPSGASTYTYSSGTNVVSPLVNTSYSVTGTSALGCIGANTAVSNVTVNITPTITVNSGVICTGQSFTMIPSGATTYTYSSGTTVVSPLVNTTYSVTGTSALGCVGFNTALSTITVNITPTITVNSGGICSGNSFTMTPGGATTYTYSSGSNVVTPLVNTSYSVTGTSALGCIATNTAISSVSINITPTITVNSGVICTGQSFTMTGSGASTYTYSSGTNVVSPLSNTFYFVTGTSALGCVASNTAISTVTVNTTPTITVNSGVICTGQSFTMTAGGATTYTYSSGINIVNPLTTTSYSVTGTSALGCVGSNTAVSSVTVNATPTITVYSGVICAGSPYTITPTGASTYTYSGGSAVVSPTTTTSYSITGTSALGCVASNTAICTLIALPLPMITVNSGTICSGSSFTIVPSGATTYTFSSGTAVVSPTTSTTYTVTGTDSDGCTNAVGAISSVTVYALPSLTVSASSTSVCSGNSSTLTVSGASSYTWNTGPTVASISVTPSITTTYTVTGTDTLGCVSTSAQTVVLFANPTISLSSSNASVCVGFNSVLMASGVNTYTWSTGLNTLSISVSPTVSTTYSVNGTDINGCVATNTSISVGINPSPTVTAVASSTGICLGALADLTASGASSYVWSTGSLISTISVSPLVNTTYTVTGTNSFGCSSDAVITIIAYATPTLTIGPDIEVALGSSYEFNPTQSGSSTYSWTPSDYLNSTNIINATTTPLNDIMYILTATSINGCTVSDTVFVKVLANLIIANYMSPNGDGVNDTWKLNVPLLIKNYSVDIIDSYNQKVYHKDDNYNNEFDGTFNGQNLPDGVYYYFIKDNSTLIYKGSITLTR